SGTVCSARQRQTPGGGVFQGTTLTKMTEASYMAAQAFSGEYTIKVRRIFGQPLGGRARLKITQNLGTPKQTVRMEIIKLDQPAQVMLQLRAGRRTDLASVASPLERRAAAKDDGPTGSVYAKLRAMSFPNFSGATKAGGAAGKLANQDRPVLPRSA